MKIKIIKIAKTRRQLIECKDFARIVWPSGATDYLTTYTDSGEGIMVGHHVGGWRWGVKRPGVQAWKLHGMSIDFSSIDKRIVWLHIAGNTRFSPEKLARKVMAML